jgi:hypothetical protein
VLLWVPPRPLVVPPLWVVLLLLPLVPPLVLPVLPSALKC